MKQKSFKSITTLTDVFWTHAREYLMIPWRTWQGGPCGRESFSVQGWELCRPKRGNSKRSRDTFCESKMSEHSHPRFHRIWRGSRQHVHSSCRRRQTFCVRSIDLVGTSLGASVVLHWLQPPSPPIFISNASKDIGPLFMTTEIYTCATRLSARVAEKDGSPVQLPSRVPTIKILAPPGASNISNNFDPISPGVFCRVAAALTDKNGAAKQDFLSRRRIYPSPWPDNLEGLL